MPACLVCRRDVGPVPPVPAWLAPWRDRAAGACSIVCLSIIADRNPDMVDPTEHEQAAMESASDEAGEYLEGLGETDLAKLTREQWMTLIEVVVTGFTDGLRELSGDDRAEPAR